MDIKIDKIAGRIIVGPIKRLGRTNIFEFDYSVPTDLYLEDLTDGSVKLHKLVYVPNAVLPFWGYLNELDLSFPYPAPSSLVRDRMHSVYPGVGWKLQSMLKVLKKDVNILPNRFTVDGDIWVFGIS